MRVNSFKNQTLYEGDFLLNWQLVEPASVDLILTDPPYGALTSALPWDVRPDLHVLSWQWARLLKTNGQIAIFCDIKTGFAIQRAFQRYFEFLYNFVWSKPSVIPRNHRQPANSVEYIFVYKLKSAKESDLTSNMDAIRTPGDPYSRKAGKSQNQNPTRKGGGNMPSEFVNESGDRFPRVVVYHPNKPAMKMAERVNHPTQKPLSLIGDIIRALSNEGDLILDPFAGSATTLVAAQSLDRAGIGFELNPEYFDTASERLANITHQMALL